MEDLSTRWYSILNRARKNVNEQSFHTWLKPTRLIDIKSGKLVVEGPNPFFIDWLAEHHRERLEESAEEELGRKMEIEFVPSGDGIRSTPQDTNTRRKMLIKEDVILPNDINLNNRYKFSEFIVGSGNRMAHAAALAVSEKPARVYNPLFIYGGVGLGKTHLIQAIGHKILSLHPTMKISYVSAESFMNELIHAIRNGITLEFKERYRTIDALLIDDVQFLAGKESTQEEFFFTFNALHDANKQIVVTCDRPPKAIPTLQERLTSRFEWGLITDIQPPDLETRIAILEKRVENEDIQIPEDVIRLIAESVKSNIRELEGSLIRILACASLTCQEITLEMAEEVLSDLVKSSREKSVNVSRIQRLVARHFDVPPDSLKAKTRIGKVVRARQVAIYLTRELTELPLMEIGKHYGGRDHSTILHAIKKIKSVKSDDPSLKRSISGLREELTT